jgi:hypothetical protein
MSHGTVRAKGPSAILAAVLAAVLATLLALAACSAAPPEPGRETDAGPAAAPAPSAAPEAAGRSARRIRLAQVFVLGGRTPRALREEIASLKAAGADAVALRAFHLRGDRYHGGGRSGAPAEGTYYRSGNSPLVDDLLPAFVEAAHEEGLEAWAWMTTLGSRWLLDEVPEAAGWQADPLTGALSRTDRLDPTHPAAAAALQSLYRDLGRTGIDAVLFQDDLVLRHGEGFGPSAVEAYRSATGRACDPRLFYEDVRRDPDGRVRVGRYTEAYRLWSRWRAARLLDLAERLSEAAAQGADGPLATCLNVYYDEIWNPEGALLWLARDLDASLERDFDRYVVMAYHRQIADETGRSGKALWEALGRMARDLAGRDLEPGRAVVKLQAVDWTSGQRLSPDELARAARPWLETAPFSIGLAPSVRGQIPAFELLEPPGRGGER